MKKPLLALAVLGGILSVVGVVVVAVFLFFLFTGIAVDELYFAGSGAEDEMAMASADMAMDREESAQAEAPASVAATAERRVAVAAPAASAGFASDAKVIRNASLSLVVANPTSAVEGIQQIVDRIPGAFVANAEVRQAGDLQPSSLTIRVPATAFDQALIDLRALAQEVLSEQVTARDVTEQYTDLDARLRNLQAAETQLLALVEQADTVEDLLKIENRLAEVRGEIEQLQGRLNVLEDRIALATIHVLLHAPPDLSVVLSAEDLPTAHMVTTFALTYRNDGSVTARDGVLSLRVPELLSVIDLGFGGVYDPLSREIRWSLSDIAAASANTVFVQLRVESTENDIQLYADIHSANADLDLGNNSASLTLSFAPDLTLQVDAPAAGAQGDTIPIYVFYSNAGTGDATDVTLRTTLPAGLTFVRADSGGSYDRETNTVEWKVGDLTAGAGDDLFMRLRVDVAEGRLQIPVAITAEQADAVEFNNRTDVFLTALREDVSARSVWQPGQTVEASLAALIVAAQRGVDVIIWVLTFGVPLSIIVLLAFGVRSGLRRMRRRRES